MLPACPFFLLIATDFGLVSGKKMKERKKERLFYNPLPPTPCNFTELAYHKVPLLLPPSPLPPPPSETFLPPHPPCVLPRIAAIFAPPYHTKQSAYCNFLDLAYCPVSQGTLPPNLVPFVTRTLAFTNTHKLELRG